MTIAETAARYHYHPPLAQQHEPCLTAAEDRRPLPRQPAGTRTAARGQVIQMWRPPRYNGR